MFSFNRENISQLHMVTIIENLLRRHKQVLRNLYFHLLDIVQ